MAGSPDTPQVLIERDDRSRATVTVVRTDIVGFVGIAERGPLATPVRIETMRQFESVFGGYLGGAYLAYATRAFFENGGRTCLVARVASDDPALGASTASLMVRDVAGGPALTITASSHGSWGNGLSVALSPARSAETVALAPPITASVLVVAGIDGFAAGDLVRVSQPGSPEQIRLLALVDPSTRTLWFVHPDPDARRPTDSPLTGLVSDRPVRIERLAYDITLCRDGRLAALYAGLGLAANGARFMGTLLKPVAPDEDGRLPADPPLITVAVAEPAPGVAPLPLAITPAIPLGLGGGRDGLGVLAVADFLAGLASLEPIRDLSVLACPDILIQPVRRLVLPIPPLLRDPCAVCPEPTPPSEALPPADAELPPIFTEDAIAQVQAAMVDQCERLRDRVALLDPPWSSVRADAVGFGGLQAWRSRFDSAFGALYAPWLLVPDPTGKGSTPVRAIPPSGHVAGQLAATDRAIGCHAAAANAPLAWAQAPTLTIEPAAHGLLNSSGVNAIVTRDGRPLKIMGARTMSSDASWRFLPVRRFIAMLRRTLDAATQWAVFEPNDQETRALLVQTIGIFLESLRRGGALAGARPVEAYRLRCDESNNPSAARANGYLQVDIAVAPVVPLEFIVLRLGRRDAAFELAEQGAVALTTLEAA